EQKRSKKSMVFYGNGLLYPLCGIIERHFFECIQPKLWRKSIRPLFGNISGRFPFRGRITRKINDGFMAWRNEHRLLASGRGARHELWTWLRFGYETRSGQLYRISILGRILSKGCSSL